MLKGKQASKLFFALFQHSWKCDKTENGNILPNLINLLTNIVLWKSITIFSQTLHIKTKRSEGEKRKEKVEK